MFRRRPTIPSLQVSACVAVVVVGTLAASAQTSNPTPAATASGQTDHSTSPAALPDAPPPASSQVHPQARAPETVESLSAQPPIPAKTAPSAPVTILEDTLIRVVTDEPVNSKRTRDGTPVHFMVSEDVFIGDVLAIPRGAMVHGMVVKSKKAGVLTGSPELTFELVSLELGGRSYPLYSYPFNVKGTSKTKPTETKAIRGAYVGAIAGAFAQSKNGTTTETARAVNMTAGAALGAGVGTAVSAASPGPVVWIPAEAELSFYLAAPITVMPVSAKEAARLAQGLNSGGPSLYVRGDAP